MQFKFTFLWKIYSQSTGSPSSWHDRRVKGEQTGCEYQTNGQELYPACLIWVVHSVPEYVRVQRTLGGPTRFVRKVFCGAQSQHLLLWALLYKYRWKSHHADDVITPSTPIVGNDPRISAATRLCLPVGPAFCFLLGGGGVRRENSSPGRGTFPTFRSAWDTPGFPWNCNHRLSGLDGSSESISTFLGF